jgi:ribosomal protein S12 methylthiotransferase accessory factor
MEVIAIDTTHPRLEIPAFYTVIPGAHFRERALATSVAMFASKLVLENSTPAVAAARLEQIDRMLPGKYYVKFYLGSSRLALGEPREALACFEAALAADPNDQDLPSIYSYMGVCLKEMERYSEALEVLAKGVALDRERTDLYNLMGFCRFKLGAHEAAIADFKRVLALNPGSAIDYANIAANYRAMGQPERAIRYYQTALTLDPEIGFARTQLAELLQATK